MDDQRRFPFPIVGGSSLLVIFSVLCLTVFALLGLSTVQAGGRLSQARADAVSAYYQADAQAEELFARLRRGELPQEVTRQGEVYSYTCPISETQQLRVELRKDPSAWIVLCWQAESTAAWVPDDTLNVWAGT